MGGGGFRGSTIQKPWKCGETAGPIGNQFCTYNAGESGNDQNSGEFHDVQRKQIKINVLKIKCTSKYNYAAMIPSEAG